MNAFWTSFFTFLPVVLLVILAIIVSISIPLRKKPAHKATKEPRK